MREMTLSVSEASEHLLNDLQVRTGAMDRGEVIRLSISFFDRMLGVTEKGGEIIVEVDGERYTINPIPDRKLPEGASRPRAKKPSLWLRIGVPILVTVAMLAFLAAIQIYFR